MPSSVEPEQPEEATAPDTGWSEPLAEPQPTASEAEATPPELELPASPTRRHPTNAVDEVVFPLADAGEYYVGLWNGHPKYGCPVCAYTTLSDKAGDGDFAVDTHIQEKANQGSEKHANLLEGKGK